MELDGRVVFSSCLPAYAPFEGHEFAGAGSVAEEGVELIHLRGRCILCCRLPDAEQRRGARNYSQ
jgi:hypothetical protein